jgi:hypothetical protein
MRKICLFLLLSSALFAQPDDQNTIILQPTEAPQYQQYPQDESTQKRQSKRPGEQDNPIDDRRYDALQLEHYGPNFEKLPNNFDNDNIDDERREDMMQD